MEGSKGAPEPAASRRKHEAAGRTQSGGPKPNENTTTEQAEREQKALHMEYEARLWADENPGRWAFMSSLALHEVRAKRRFGMKWLIEQCRRKDFAGSKMGSNTLAPALARILIEEHPECRRFMSTRHSIVDEAR
ncbi:hypothetical protein [Gordonibacter sp.]|uniref:hypothetical protein n=1 Tax=Gordonibacter sp. TaxID=1968902 RepID=UPI002FC6B926